MALPPDFLRKRALYQVSGRSNLFIEIDFKSTEMGNSCYFIVIPVATPFAHLVEKRHPRSHRFWSNCWPLRSRICWSY